MRVTRRDLMKLFGAAGVRAMLGPAYGQTAGLDPDRLFLFVYMAGGWDQTLFADPRNPADDSDPASQHQMGWNLLPTGVPGLASGAVTRGNITFGPAIGGLERHSDKLCVVRGMSMDTLTHQVGYRYFLTGKPPSGLTPRGSSMGSEVVDQLARAYPGRPGTMANFTLDTDSYYTGDRLEAKAFRGSSRNALAVTAAGQRRLLDTVGDVVLDASAGGGAVTNLIAEHRARAFCDPAQLDASGVMTRVRGAQHQYEELLADVKLKAFSFREVQTVVDSLPYGGGGVPAPGTPGLAAFFSRQALASGLSNAVTVTLQDNLDTHTNQHSDQHPRRLVAAFDALARLIDDLAVLPHPVAQGSSLLSKTTFVVFSEFSRTARLNASGGRDHSLTNCCLLGGAGIRGNTVVGASTPGAMEPQAIDVNTGAVLAGGTVVKPEHVLASVLQSAGYDRNNLLVPGLPCVMR